MPVVGAEPPLPCPRADLTALPFPDGSVEGEHAAHAMQNVERWHVAVAELVRVLVPGGPLLAAWGGSRLYRRTVGSRSSG